MTLRENISGHPTRFELVSKKKHTILLQVSYNIIYPLLHCTLNECPQADSLEEKLKWTDFIQDLLMKQMKQLKGQQPSLMLYDQ